MPANIGDRQCPVCGERHRFFYRPDLVNGAAIYTFTCPKNGTAGRLAFAADGAWFEIVSSVPRGSVEVFEEKRR